MNVLISGASGLIGSALKTALSERGDRVLALTRQTSLADSEITWDPASGQIDTTRLDNLDAVIHLAGENIAASRWTPAQKARIRDSRVFGTTLIAQTLAQLPTPPKVFISASAIGYYGHRSDETLTESSTPGDGFLPDVCIAWEDAAKPAIEAGIRTVYPRIGIVLSPDGGALAKMRLPFKLGLGGIIGSGTQYMSWIGLNDLISILLFAIDNNTISGPINAVSPTPVTNREFTKTLGRALSRPTLFPLPAFIARLALGEMANAL
ncbi:MAG: TIGR01777 family oxidoreductase, partial [Candidatus Latescibacteria bacterium]|nr:TIGR01777 family oxidoreductase [Candidatus Latescibacterota bacterium]